LPSYAGQDAGKQGGRREDFFEMASNLVQGVKIMCLKRFRWTCVGTALLVFMLPPSGLAKRESHDFTLHPSESLAEPYIQEYEIALEREGLIRVHVSVATVDRKMKKPLLLGISNKRKRKIRTTALYSSKDKGAVLRHTVDSQELKIGRNYIVSIGNISTQHNATGTLAINYPAGPEEPKPTASPPDLTIDRVLLTEDCRVMVTLINKGPGLLPDSAWKKKTSPTLMLYRNGKSWGGANLTVIDPKQRLKDVNGRARYVSGLKVGGQTNIKAVIDYHGIMAEGDKFNNAQVEALQCK